MVIGRRWGCSSSCGWGLVVLVALLLNQPEWIEEFRPEEKPAIAVFWDASSSMDTRDVVTAGQAASQPTTRHEAIRALIDPSSWNKLRDRMNIVLQAVAEPRAGHGTDLNDPLTHAPEKIANLRGVVMASDGDWNDGPPPVEAAARLRMRGIPIFAVPVGSRDPAARRRALEPRRTDLRRIGQGRAYPVFDR